MEYAGILTGMITGRVQTLAKAGQGVTPDTAIGLAGAIQHVQTVLQQLGQAKDVHGQRVQMMAQGLAQAMQMLQALAQARPQPEVPPETQGKIVSMQTLAESKARISEANAAQKLQQRDAAHQQRLAQEQVKTQADIEAQDYKTAAEIARTRAQSNAEAAQKAKQEKETEE